MYAPGVALMAAEAGFVLYVRRDGFRGQIDHAAGTLAAAGIDVGRAVAVTGRARAGAGRGTRIGLRAVFRGLVALDLSGMTVRADFRPGSNRVCAANTGKREKKPPDHSQTHIYRSTQAFHLFHFFLHDLIQD